MPSRRMCQRACYHHPHACKSAADTRFGASLPVAKRTARRARRDKIAGGASGQRPVAPGDQSRGCLIASHNGQQDLGVADAHVKGTNGSTAAAPPLSSPSDDLRDVGAAPTLPFVFPQSKCHPGMPARYSMRRRRWQKRPRLDSDVTRRQGQSETPGAVAWTTPPKALEVVAGLGQTLFGGQARGLTCMRSLMLLQECGVEVQLHMNAARALVPKAASQAPPPKDVP
ncbi:hypothetical protein B0T11DRAFT_313533 [Plectosphaerella cucumerina]|uniref:Uncharacterized protein n=1 Tax=Plectosphaerella cucumerina TaxID=40658 RepID=A0A8K0TQH2_9PEZI|nr:hypothetical protein B0T11DRAFT_313533 [Plectosphaerella cucumerina]